MASERTGTSGQQSVAGRGLAPPGSADPAAGDIDAHRLGDPRAARARCIRVRAVQGRACETGSLRSQSCRHKCRRLRHISLSRAGGPSAPSVPARGELSDVSARVSEAGGTGTHDRSTGPSTGRPVRVEQLDGADPRLCGGLAVRCGLARRAFAGNFPACAWCVRLGGWSRADSPGQPLSGSWTGWPDVRVSGRPWWRMVRPSPEQSW